VTRFPRPAAVSVSLAAMTGINLLVVAKYAPRVHAPVVALCLAYAAAVTGCALWSGRHSVPERWRRILPAAVVAVTIVGSWFVLQRVEPESLRVDRWSAIAAFNDRLWSGQFPYDARTHLGSRVSGLPLVFFLGLPFQQLGDVGYLQPFAFALFGAVAIWLWGRRFDVFWPLLLLATSPAFLWELAVRSDLMSNALLAVLAMVAADGWLRSDWGGRFWMAGVLAGLCLSTRLALAVPLIVYFSGSLRGTPWRTAARVPVLCVVVMAATLLPFALWDWQRFIAYNPLTWQTSLLPLSVQAVAVSAAVALGWSSGNLAAASFRGGLLMFFAVSASFALVALAAGFGPAMRDTRFDISYFDLAVPFLLVPLLFARPLPPRPTEEAGVGR
jgi:hypothetical protein